LGTLLLGAGIPLLEFLPIFQEDNPVVVYFQPISDGSFYVQSAVSEAVTTSFFDWSRFFLGLYIIGVAIFSVRFFIGLGKIHALYRKSEIIQKENHTLVLTNEPHLPFSFFKYMFWSKDLEMNDVDGQKIVTHEEAHVKGWHSVDVILLEIFSIIFWVSPMVYFYKKSLKTVHEYLADAVVLQTTPTKKYGHLLLRQSQSGLQIALANHFFHSQLKQRIVMMTRSKSRKEAIVKYLFAIPVILLLLIAFSKKEAMANNENLPTEKIENNNYKNLNSILDAEMYLENEVDEMPLFPGCEEEVNKEERKKCSNKKLLTFIYTQIKYPAEARKAGIQGKVIIKYVVKQDGTIANARIENDIGGGCGDAALKVIKALPKMIPGTKDGKAVDVDMLIPVSFKLAGDTKETPKSTVEKVEEENSNNAVEEIMVVGFSPKLNTSSNETIFKVVEEMPRFNNQDCEKIKEKLERKKCAEMAMLKFIYSNIKYPKAARDAGIQGRVIIEFVVQKDGSITDAEVLRDPGGGCGVEAERVVNMMPDFVPGKHRGEAVNVSYTLPVSFKLAGPDPKTDVKIEDNKIKRNKDMRPLFIVDGVEFDKSTAGELKPNDIATMNVLKGEKATEKYGDKGKNGVIEITLKDRNSESAELRTHPIEKKTELEAAGLTYVKISPNPTDGKINIEYGSQDKPMTISISDMNGREIYSRKVEGGRSSLQDVDVSKAVKGMLLVSFFQDGKTYTEKVILQ